MNVEYEPKENSSEIWIPTNDIWCEEYLRIEYYNVCECSAKKLIKWMNALSCYELLLNCELSSNPLHISILLVEHKMTYYISLVSFNYVEMWK